MVEFKRTGTGAFKIPGPFSNGTAAANKVSRLPKKSRSHELLGCLETVKLGNLETHGQVD